MTPESGTQSRWACMRHFYEANASGQAKYWGSGGGWGEVGTHTHTQRQAQSHNLGSLKASLTVRVVLGGQ